MAPTRERDRDETGPPGAGTLFVYGTAPVVDDTRWDALTACTTQPTNAPSPDSLLARGIADYTYTRKADGGILGRGKFSTVYRVTSGQREFALKHTPLYPHHPLIAARLLREPTLLAHLAPHPCLIGVDGFVRTEGHFYLVEECAATSVPLPKHPGPVVPSRAAAILDQLVSVVRDGLHAGRVCHRDLKGDNVLVDVATGDVLLLDLGLATHFSASEPKLTTCCGSPAFHSPEIVNALNHRPGEVTYYGPEVDIWCIALTMLALLLQVRFPLGPTHTSRHIMADRAADRLQELDELYPPDAPWRALGPHAGRGLSADEQTAERHAWARVRRALKMFVDIDAKRRIAAFKAYDVGDVMRARVESHAAATASRSFKTTTFLPSEVKYTLRLYLEPHNSSGPLVMRNPSGEPERRIISYIKYLLRCAGILYHHVPDSQPVVLQLVLPLGMPPAPDANPPRAEPARDWVASLFGLGKKTPTPPPSRSFSVPPPASARGSTPAPTPGPATRGKKGWGQQVWLRIDVERPPSSTSRPPSRAPSRAPSRPGSRASSASRTHASRASSRSRKASDGELVPLPEGEVPAELDPNGSATPVPPPVHAAEAVQPVGLGMAADELLPQHLNHKLHLRISTPAPSPLSRTVTPTTTDEAPTSPRWSGNGGLASPRLLPLPNEISPPTSPRPGFKRSQSSHRVTHTPRVLLTLTEPRGYELLFAALAAAVPPPATRTGSMDEKMMPMSPVTRALAIPSSGSSGNGSASASDNELDLHDEEEERGRPRSKEAYTPERDGRSATVRPGTTATAADTTPQASRSRRPAKDSKTATRGFPTTPGTARPGSVERRDNSAAPPKDMDTDTEADRDGDALRSRKVSMPPPVRRPSGLLESLFGKQGSGKPANAVAAALAAEPLPMHRRSSSVPPLPPQHLAMSETHVEIHPHHLPPA